MKLALASACVALASATPTFADPPDCAPVLPLPRYGRLDAPWWVYDLVGGDFDEDGRIDLLTIGGRSATLLQNGGAFGFSGRLVALGGPATADTYGVAAGDLDGDGHLDLLNSWSDGFLRTGFGNGDGTFGSWAPSPPVPLPSFATQVLLGDADSDGDADAFLLLAGSPTPITVLPGDGTGAFSTAPTISGPGIGPGRAALGDVNADGTLDLVTCGAGLALALIGDGHGGFSASWRGLAGGYSCAVGDLDQDGDGDVVCTAGSQSLAVFRTDSITGLGTAIQYYAGTTAGCVAIADSDGDGLPEVLAAGAGVARFDVLSDATLVLTSTTDGAIAGSGGAAVARDFNGDGRADLASVGGDASVCVALSDSAGGVHSRTFLSVGASGRALLAADLDGDGHDDLVSWANSSSVEIWRSDGVGGFSAPNAVPMPFTVRDVVIADVAGSSAPDLCAIGTNYSSACLAVLPGAGDGTFGSLPLNCAGGDFLRLRAADFDLEGYVDLFAARPDGIFVLLNSSSGLSSVWTNVYPLPTSPPTFADFVLGDLNSDGRPDLVVAENFGGYPVPSGRVSVSLGVPGGAFIGGSSAYVGSSLKSVAVADVDGDGKRDVVAAGSPTIVFFRGNGIAGLAGPVEFPVSGTPLSIALTRDLDRDGRAEAIFAAEDSLVVLRSDAEVGLQAPLRAFADSGLSGVAVLDVDGDGDLDAIASGSASSFSLLRNDASLPLATVYGSGKAGTIGVPSLTTLGSPSIGESCSLWVTNALPFAASFLAVGLAPAALPFDGGTLLVTPAALLPMPPFSATGTLDVSATLPVDPSLCSAHLYFQNVFVDPGAAGFHHTAQTNGVAWTIGS